MRSPIDHIEISEEQLENIDLIATIFLSDENDPRSLNYKRKLIRPAINWRRIILIATIALSLLLGLFWLLVALETPYLFATAICIGALFVCVLANLKKITICLVQIYQHFAPSSLREKCRYEPSCSEYMILAIQKYGAIMGLYKGLRRLSRCNIYNGGFDYP